MELNHEMAGLSIVEGRREQAADLTRLIMMAMTDDCCLYFAGEGRTTDDFYRVMHRLVREEQSQYTFRNTLVALCDGKVAGCCVAYDGGQLHELREAFFKAMLEELGRTFDTFDDETSEGEYYIDSLAVYPNYRGQGIATELLRATIARGKSLNLTPALLVDAANANAERLYTALGFTRVNDDHWGGHPMHRLHYLQ